jgi:glutathione S-transferase
MASKDQLILGYWNIRGFAEPSRLLLHYTKTPFTNKLYQFGDTPDFKREEWLKDKNSLGLDFPNLPYLIDGDLKLSQARTILTHLGRKFKLMGSNERETSLIELLIDQSNDLRQELNNVCYRAINFDAVRKKFCDETLPIHLKLFEDFLTRQGKKWLLGDSLTAADFQLFEYLDHCWLLSNDNWEEYPKILAYMKEFRALPELKKYFDSEHSKRPINGKMAKFGGTVVQHEEKKKEEPPKTDENEKPAATA